MKNYTVVFTPEAEEQLAELYRYIGERASAVTALRYAEAIVDYCATFETFPHRGVLRGDIRPGLRLTNYKKNALIGFVVDDDARTVTIVGIFYRGRDHLRMLQNQGKL